MRAYSVVIYLFIYLPSSPFEESTHSLRFQKVMETTAQLELKYDMFTVDGGRGGPWGVVVVIVIVAPLAEEIEWLEQDIPTHSPPPPPL